MKNGFFPQYFFREKYYCEYAIPIPFEEFVGLRAFAWFSKAGTIQEANETKST